MNNPFSTDEQILDRYAIEKLADPTVHTALMYVKPNGPLTYEEGLIACILELSRQNAEMKKRITKLLSLCGIVRQIGY